MRYLPYLCLVALLLGGAADARAQDHEVGHWPGLLSFNVVSEKQVVRIGDAEFGFEADVTVCLNRKNRGFGFVELSSADNALRLVPVWGTFDWRTRGVVLIFVPVVERQIGPDDIVVAVVQPATADPDCLIWDLIGTGVSGSLPPPFEAEGTISLSRRGPESEPVDYGQLDARVWIDTPLQPVEPLPPSTIVGFESQILLDRNQAARGCLDVYLPRSEPVRYETIFGAAFPGDDDEGSIRAVVILLLADRQGPLNTNDHVLRATVVEQKTNALDDCCLIWDLINGESQVNGTFQAVGTVRIEQLNNKYPENVGER